MPIILIDKIEQSNRSDNVTTSGFFYLVDSIDTNFNVTGRQTNASDPAAGSGPSAGERWIVEDVSDVSGYFSAGLGAAEDNDIVEYSGSAWSVIVDVDNAKTDEGQLVYVEDENLFYFYNGTSWGELGSGGTTYTAGGGLTLAGTEFSHTDTSSQASSDNSGRTYIQDITLDTFGHVTGLATATETVTNTDTTYTAGSGLTLAGTEFSHTDTSSQASSDNSGRTYIQDITLDTFGHVTGLATATETVTNTDTTYTAGSGLTLAGTEFSHTDTSSQASSDNSGRTYIQDITLDTFGHVTGLATATETVTDTTYTAGDGLDLSGTSFSADLKANGGLVIDSTEIAVDLGASSITGTLAVGDGGTGLTSLTTLLNSNVTMGGLTDGSNADGVLTYKDADEATVEANLEFDGTTLKVGSAAYGGDVDGLVVAAPAFTLNNGTIDTLSIENGGRITTNSGIRAFGTTYQLGPKGGGTTNFISNEGVKTTLTAAIGTGYGASGNVATVTSTDGMKVGDAVFITSVNSNADNTANGSGAGTSSEFEIASITSTTQFTVTATNFYVAGAAPPAPQPPHPPAPGWGTSGSWVDVLGTGNLNFRNANVNEDPSGVARDLQFDYANGSFGRDGGSLKFRSRRRRTASGEATNTERLIVDKDGKLTFNPSEELTADFCVEGGTDTALLYVDASTDRVGISTPSPRHMLDVRGSYGGAATGPKAVNYTLSATDFMVFVTVHASSTFNITTPAVYAEGRVIYIICDSGGTGTGKHQIVANSGQTILYDTTADDSVFQLSKVGQMITLIGTRTADTWVCVKTGHQPHTHTATLGAAANDNNDHHTPVDPSTSFIVPPNDHTVTIGTT